MIHGTEVPRYALTETCRRLGVTREELCAPTRGKAGVALARRILWYVLSEALRLTDIAVAQLSCDLGIIRHRKTVYDGLAHVRALMAAPPADRDRLAHHTGCDADLVDELVDDVGKFRRRKLLQNALFSSSDDPDDDPDGDPDDDPVAPNLQVHFCGHNGFYYATRKSDDACFVMRPSEYGFQPIRRRAFVQHLTHELAARQEQVRALGQEIDALERLRERLMKPDP